MVDQIKKILVPLDGSKNSMKGLNSAIALAKPLGAEIKAVYVRPTPPIFGRMKPMYAEKITADDTFLDSAKKLAEKNGVKFTAKITEFQKPGDYIVKLAQKQNFDLIVIGARGMGSVKEFFLGSVSHYIIHKSKIQVLVVK
ncbi:MAG: universal stress protein [Nitrosopumilus sp.]|nr:universal stress protein [Nitrosopumilus sp.]MDH3487404.1 universal stress protein [Nitrosopumilus sp.]